MAIRTKRIKGGNGINYTKEVDDQSDWISITNNTYFKDLSDGLIYWKDLSGVVIAIYELGGGSGSGGVDDMPNVYEIRTPEEFSFAVSESYYSGATSKTFLLTDNVVFPASGMTFTGCCFINHIQIYGAGMTVMGDLANDNHDVNTIFDIHCPVYFTAPSGDTITMSHIDMNIRNLNIQVGGPTFTEADVFNLAFNKSSQTGILNYEQINDPKLVNFIDVNTGQTNHVFFENTATTEIIKDKISGFTFTNIEGYPYNFPTDKQEYSTQNLYTYFNTTASTVNLVWGTLEVDRSLKLVQLDAGPITISAGTITTGFYGVQTTNLIGTTTTSGVGDTITVKRLLDDSYGLTGQVYLCSSSGGAGGTTGGGDYGNIIFVSEVGPTGQTRNDVIGDILKPVELNWASQIAQSGDTIHVKAGSYTSTTVGQYGLTVNGVNHYFEEKAKVYKTTTGPMFGREGSFGQILTDGNVYGSGSFYTSSSCQYTYFTLGFSSGGALYSGFYSNPSIFEFDECVSSSNASVVFGGAGSSVGDVIVKGKTKIVNSGGHGIALFGSFGEKVTIDCPFISTSNVSSNAITFGNGGGGGGDVIVNSVVIEATGTPTDFAIDGVGSEGKFVCTASYITRVQVGAGSTYRSTVLNVDRVDYASVSANIVTINGHVGELYVDRFTNADVELCDTLNIVSGNMNATANIIMSNITGATSVLGGGGTINLSSSDVTTTRSTENPLSGFTSYVTGAKDYIIAGNSQKVNLMGRWDNGDTFTHGGAGDFTLNISNDTYVKETTFTSINGTGGKLQIQGKTEDCQINHIDGRLVINGATMLVSDQNKQIITAPSPSKNVKVYSAGLSTNKFGPFTGATEMIKVDVTSAIVQVTINGEVFTTVTSVIAGQAATELAGLINASGTVSVTASQDTPGTDLYIYVTASVLGTGITITYDSNTSFNEQIRYNSNLITNTVGGTVIEDTDID